MHEEINLINSTSYMNSIKSGPNIEPRGTPLARQTNHCLCLKDMLIEDIKYIPYLKTLKYKRKLKNLKRSIENCLSNDNIRHLTPNYS